MWVTRPIPHKVLTGRRDQLQTIRRYEGLAPFCAIHESRHDIMGAGHASTAIGYAVGIKEAMRAGHGEDGKVVAVVGDGAMTGGVAFEAVHQAGGNGTPIVVLLNDNGMSIAPNVGALSRYFNRVRLNPKLWHAREDVEDGLTKLPALGATFERLGPHVKESIKAFWAPGLWWEELDFAYMGVIDGHDVRALRRALREALAAERPVVVHCATVKGKGFAPAEDGGLEGMEKWHAAKPKSIAHGAPAAQVRKPPERQAGAAAVHAGVRQRARGRMPPRRPRDRDHRRDELGHRPEHPPARAARSLLRRRASPSSRRCCSPPAWRCRAASRSPRSTRRSCSAPTTRSSTTSACRSSTSTFVMDRAGLVGDDGPTHHGVFDIAYLRCLPNIVLMAPRDEAMLVHMLRTALTYDDGPIALRYPARRGRRRAAARAPAGDRDRHRRDPA